MYGLSLYEGEVYFSLLSEGSTTLAALAERISRQRPTVTRALKGLEKQGLIFVKKKGKRAFFFAASPVLLRPLLVSRLASGEKQLSEMEVAYRKSTESMTIRNLEGKKAIQDLFLEMIERLPRGDSFYRYIAGSDRVDFEPYVHPDYRARRDAKQIQQFAISSLAMKGKPFKKGMGCLWKVVPPSEDTFEYGMAQLIFGSTVAFIDYVTETAFVIEGERFAKFQRAIHKTLYTRLQDRVV